MVKPKLPGFLSNPKKNIILPRKMETTSRTTANSHSRYNWLNFRSNRSIDNKRVWVFVDGSSNGWHSAVILKPGESIRKLASFVESTAMRNVSSELDALLLGLQYAPEDSTITIVHDYIGIGAWMINAWKIKKKGVRKRIIKAKNLIEDKSLNVQFIHHNGHQKDKTDFTYWNNIADGLCSDGVKVDENIIWSDR